LRKTFSCIAVKAELVCSFQFSSVAVFLYTQSLITKVMMAALTYSCCMQTSSADWWNVQ